MGMGMLPIINTLTPAAALLNLRLFMFRQA
jgi:hypothetical protein